MQSNRSGLFLIRLLALLAVAFVAAPAAAGDLDRTGPAERAQSDVPGQLAQACPRIYRPVCAFTPGGWRTYGNSCLARNAGARLIRQGACRASDNGRICCQRGRREFFSSRRECRRAGGRIVPDRFCRRLECGDRRPVCGWWRGQRRNFANICELRRSGGRFIRYGRCQAQQTCHQAGTSRRYPHVQGRSWHPACRAAPAPRTCHQRGTSRNIPHIRGRSWDPACSGAGGGAPQRPQAGSPCTTKDRHNITVQGRIFIDKNGFPVCMSDSSGRPRP